MPDTRFLPILGAIVTGLVLVACGPTETTATTTTPVPTTTLAPTTTTATVVTTTVTTTPQPEPETTTTTTVQQDDTDQGVEIEVEAGMVVGGARELSAGVGETVRLLVTADVEDHVHVHGYDLFFDLAPGEETEIVFTADVPGIFEIELEGTHLLLAELEVS